MNRPELIIGIVSAVGTDTSVIYSEIEARLDEVGYKAVEITLSQLPKALPDQAFMDGLIVKDEPYDEYLSTHMDLGNRLRFHYKRGDIMALLSIMEIREQRILLSMEGNSDVNSIDSDEESIKANTPLSDTAFIIRSLKHEKEVELLRSVYGDSFFLLSGYCPRNLRLQKLSEKIARSHHDNHGRSFESKANALIERDEEETVAEITDLRLNRKERLERKKLGQQVRETFWRGDAYFDASSIATIKRDIKRIIQIIFSHPFHTPTADEMMMFVARAAAMRSASMGRQVGAAIATSEGSIIAMGANEVPKAGGGQYWEDDENDARDHILGHDSSDTMRRELLADILQRLEEEGWTPPIDAGNNATERVTNLLYGDSPALKGSSLDGLIEYQRPVHAEMAAITDAARRTVSVQDGILYSTTFPCHSCARHIVASGIARVVFIEPYAKSLAITMHQDSISIDTLSKGGDRVKFEPFVGIAPRRYLSLFQIGEMIEFGKRKDAMGRKNEWKRKDARPRIGNWQNSQSIKGEIDVIEQWNSSVNLVKILTNKD